MRKIDIVLDTSNQDSEESTNTLSINGMDLVGNPEDCRVVFDILNELNNENVSLKNKLKRLKYSIDNIVKDDYLW